MQVKGSVEVIPTTFSYVFSPYRDPIARVSPGQRVVIHCEDAFESRIQSARDIPSRALAGAKFLNPQTGPIYIEDAAPGDTLAVRIEDISPTRDFAISCLIPYFGGLTSTPITRTLQAPLEERVWLWRLENGHLRNDELQLSLPWQPFMGTLAVAPDLEAISTLAPGPFGGNMDVPDVCPGNTVYLPVWNDGALFYTGDTHARQGQGELCGVALEITSKVTVVFDVIKAKEVSWPRIESADRLMAVGSARPMEDAARIAYAELVTWLEADYGWRRLDAYQLLTQAGGLYVGNMVDTTYSLVASIDKHLAARRSS
ncbi:MAG: acetamidase [Chloroflexi bacterium]|nr:MAG: acetamidase [Chloroflexota bacterium]TMF37094.1 MAG: acetamidase [Chloroflexota bacterium]